MPTCAFISFRLGLTDGVSVVAESWMEALSSFGFEVVTIAGEGPVDRLVPGLAIDAVAPPSDEEIDTALRAVDLVVVENLLTIPMNLPASRIVARALRGRPALLHHHDPPWQRERYRDVCELPVDDPAWRHVTINHLTANEMAVRGVRADVIYNGFDTDPGEGQRARTRDALGIDSDALLVVQPVRAIERKAVPAAVALAEQLGATYWLTGVPEEGYDAHLERVLAAARCPVVRGTVADLDDLYAAGDVVAFPSTWEGFGNPPIEASLRLRPVAVAHYPVLDELLALGFRWFDVGDVRSIAAFLAHPDQDLLRHNRSLACEHFSLDQMRARLRNLLVDAGWLA